jgi:hypothetical protein
MLAPIAKVGQLYRIALDVRIVVADPDQALRMRARQRTQQHRVHHAEDRGVHADPEGKSQNDDRREPRIAAQHAETVPHILEQLLEPHPAPDLPRVFFHARDIAELAERRVARLFGRHAAFDIIARLPLDVVANVVVETV